MKKLLLLAAVGLTTLALAGCNSFTLKTVKATADKVCSVSENERAVLRDKVDEATYPHRVRVECNVQ